MTALSQDCFNETEHSTQGWLQRGQQTANETKAYGIILLGGPSWWRSGAKT